MYSHPNYNYSLIENKKERKTNTQTQEEDYFMASIHVKRRLSSLSPAPPPPSPIPNIRDSPNSDSAAAANISRFSQNMIMDRSKVLNLPDYVRRSVMAGIDYQLLLLGDEDTIAWLLRSAAEFGAFRISNHGLSAEDLRSTLTESGWVFGLSSEFCRRVGDYREEFMWCRSGETSVAKLGKEVVGSHKYRSFSQEIENVGRKLETIAEELGHIFSKNASKLHSGKEIQLSEATLSLSRHNHPSTLRGQSQHSSYPKTQEQDSCKQALSLHFPVDQGQFCIHSEVQSPSSFNTGPDTIVITIGGQLAEWSKGEFKSAYGEVNFKPELQGNKTSFSFELKCSPSNLIRDVSIKRTISLVDQIVIILIVIILYRIVTFIWF